MKKALTTIFITFALFAAAAQTGALADRIRIKYRIPELAYAVVSADSVLEFQVLGVRRHNTKLYARPADRFHIGSNTKAITSFIAALLVHQGAVKWDTRFFELFPELKKGSRAVYSNITLQDLLTFRGRLPSWSYGSPRPYKKEITGSESRQRYLLAKFFLSLPPMDEQDGLTPSNADYVLAGMMLEKASGKAYKQLVVDFGKSQGISFCFGYPNVSDRMQPWGHDSHLKPLPPMDNYKLDWLLPAGNINVSLPDYLRFIQLQLNGLKGNPNVLPSSVFNRLLFGLPEFSFGWFSAIDSTTKHAVAFNEGNAGAFITEVQIVGEADRGYIIFTNAATNETKVGTAALLQALKERYGR